MILDVQSVSKSFGEDVLFEDVSFHIENHEKAALVGINGAGKTTLLRILVGQTDADSGSVALARDASFGYLEQQPSHTTDLTIMEELLTVKADLIETERAIRSSEQTMKTLTGEALEAEMARYSRLTEFFEREGGYSLKSEAQGVLKGLGFTEEEFDRPSSVLSGGQRTRLAMGRLLLAAPDLLLLDEPTNHLDLKAIIWLETYLQNYRGAVLIVSHDRYFLNRVVSKVIELDAGRSHVYSGSFDDYTRKKEERLKAAYNAYIKAERERAHQEAVIKKLQQFNREKSIRRAESRRKVLDKMTVPERPVTDLSDMKLRLRPRFESGTDVLDIEGLGKSFDSLTLFTNVDLSIKRGERVVLIGANGTGKSTLLKIINSKLAADRGEIRFGTKVTVGYYDQEMHGLSDDKTVFDEISDDYPTLDQTQIRSVLAAFLFTGEDVFKMIGTLSGGEKARVSLAKLMLSEANFLILDEPTNHLDIQSKEILENALSAYEGTVLAVSHDRYFINRVATRTLELDNKEILSYYGNYDSYLLEKEKREAILKARSEEAGLTGSAGSPGSSSDRTAESTAKADWQAQKAEEARKRKLASDLKRTEERIASLEEESESLAARLEDPAVASDPQKCLEITERLAAVGSELEELYEKWEELAEA